MSTPALATTVPTFRIGSVYSNDDYTYFVPASQKPSEGDNEALNASLVRQGSWEGRLALQSDQGRIEGRALVARAFEGRFLSITLRKEGPHAGNALPADGKKVDLSSTAYSASDLSPDSRRDFAVAVKALAAHLAQLIFRRERPARGLVLIAGSTGCSKSQVARALLGLYLESLALNTLRPPHLVTLEDPIEKLLIGSPLGPQTLGVHYTPRALGSETDKPLAPHVDCSSLARGLRDALRMTPAALYVGEIRRHDDWSEILNFAGTGHFVLTTGHAGSLTEAYKGLLDALKARSPAQRGFVAERVLAIIHLAVVPITCRWPGTPDGAGPLGDAPSTRSSLLPHLWRRTPSSVSSLVSDGLSSLQPGRPTDSEIDAAGCLSRAWFARRLICDSWPAFAAAPDSAAVADELAQGLQVALVHDIASR